MWDIRYRPLKFSDTLGQESNIRLLKARLSRGTAFDTSYMFLGGHGSGKCVVGDTLVPTDQGLVRIRDLMGDQQISPSGRTVLQETGTAKAAFSYRGGLRSTVKIRTHLGFQNEGTPNHRILVLNLAGIPDWRCLSDIRVGDIICLVPRGLFGQDVDLSNFAYEKKTNDRPSISFNHPKKMTPSLGRLLGYMVGDGTGPTRNGVIVSCAEPDVIEDITVLFRSLLGSFSITPDKRRRTLVSLRCSRVQSRAFLAYAGIGYVKAGQKEVPWSVLRSSKEVVREFLRGYFECDGGISSASVEFSSKSEALARQVQLLLLQFGIVGRLSKKPHPKYGAYWRCRIGGTDAFNFKNEIGFISKRKQKALDDLTANCRFLTRSIPHQKQCLRDYFSQLTHKTGSVSRLFRARRPGYGLECTESILRAAVEYDPLNPVTPHFARLLKAAFAYDRVVALDTGKAEVFDLNVPDGESFVANGFVNHNTTLARIHARAMLCQNLDISDPEPCNTCDNCVAVLKDQSEAFSERDAASQGKIEHIRALVEKLDFAVNGAKMRIELFDEAHRMGDGAQDVLLKPLEEKKLVGIFCTTEPNKIKGTIRTRCEEYAIRKTTREDILKRARFVCDSEGVSAEDDALLTIIDSSGGHIRDVLNKMEMIAQLGPISIESTREYLRLGSINIYYDILLSLADPTKAISLVDQACENVAPEDVVAGIAEAAMNSYRLSNNMYTEFALVDRSLGKQVYDLYGPSTIRLADYFLRNRYGSRVGLMRDVLLLTQLSGNLPPEQGLQAPPIVLGTVPRTIAVAASPVVVKPETLQPADTTPSKPIEAKIESPVPSDPRLHNFGPATWAEPRKRKDMESHPTFPPIDETRVLKPEEWKRAFLSLWPGASP